MTVGIASVGLVTAQGSARDFEKGTSPNPPRPLPWPIQDWYACGLCRPATGIDSHLTGEKRWRALADAALDACLGHHTGNADMIIATCNGACHDYQPQHWERAFQWSSLSNSGPLLGHAVPLVSGSCTSGLQALYLAKLLVEATQAEIVVLAVDMLSRASHENFESLRVLAPRHGLPWQAESEGFIPGEAAVALRLTPRPNGTCLAGPFLGGDDVKQGLLRLHEAWADMAPDLVFGQGSGPAAMDRAELASVGAVMDERVPITTALWQFGHTNGASSLLPVALGWLAQQRPGGLPGLCPAREAMDGRPLAARTGGNRIAVVCHALGGSAAVAGLRRAKDPIAITRTHAREPRHWHTPVDGPSMHPLLRKISRDAPKHRPERPPDLLLVALDTPLIPPKRAFLGARLLPSAVLEITPGTLPHFIANRWGYAGPAICLLAGAGYVARIVRQYGFHVYVVNIKGREMNRHVEWNA